MLSGTGSRLEAHRGRSLVVAGPRQPAEVHALAHWINQALGNAGVTVTYSRPPRETVQPQVPSLQSLAAEMAAGQVETLVILGGNPAFNAPADLDLARSAAQGPAQHPAGPGGGRDLGRCLLASARRRISWSPGATAARSDGTASIQQPLIEPLYGGRTAAEVVALLTGYKDRRAYDIVRNYWLRAGPPESGEDLAQGAARRRDPRHRTAGSEAVTANAKRMRLRCGRSRLAARPDLEVAFYPGWASWDGRYANNGWLQETPDPMTGSPGTTPRSSARPRRASSAWRPATWSRSPAAGARRCMPVLIQPGHADECVSVALGYGRTRCGRVGRNVGHNAYALRTTGALWSAPGVEIRKTGRTDRLALTQNHHSMEGRPLMLEATLEEYRKDPKFVAKSTPHEEPFSLYKERTYDQGYQWGMSIDLNACVGCNACVVACQAENNIPIVGKDQVTARPRDALDSRGPLLPGSARRPAVGRRSR